MKEPGMISAIFGSLLEVNQMFVVVVFKSISHA